MKRYNILHPIFMSFYSKALYKDVALNWRGICFFYLLLILALCWIPLMYQIDRGIDKFVQQVSSHVAENFPDVTIEDGIVSINKPVPFFVRDTNGNIIAIIDTQNDYSSLVHTPAQVILTKTKLIVKQDKDDIRVIDIPSDANFTVGQREFNVGLNFIGRWLTYVFYPMAVIGSLFYRLLQVLIYAAIGTLILAKIMKSKLDYQAIVRLSVIAITPAIIISTVLSFFAISFPYELLLYFILSMLYLSYGIKAAKPSNGETVTEEKVSIPKDKS